MKTSVSSISTKHSKSKGKPSKIPQKASNLTSTLRKWLLEDGLPLPNKPENLCIKHKIIEPKIVEKKRFKKSCPTDFTFSARVSQRPSLKAVPRSCSNSRDVSEKSDSPRLQSVPKFENLPAFTKFYVRNFAKQRDLGCGLSAKASPIVSFSHLSPAEQAKLKTIDSLSKSNTFFGRLLKNFLKSRHKSRIFEIVANPNGFRLSADNIWADQWYDHREKIGMGTFGNVFLCSQLLTGKLVAVKSISKDQFTATAATSLKNELGILKMFRWQENITHLIDFYETPRHFNLVFEWTPNRDLLHYCTLAPMFRVNDSRIKPLMRQVAQALAALHEKGIAHYDLKPENILIDRKGNAVLSDFGVSQVVEVQMRDNIKVGGTPVYAAPEVIAAQPNCSTQADIWSFGVMVYYMSYGKLPFPATPIKFVQNEKISVKHCLLSKAPEFEEANDLIRKTLKFDPKARPTIHQLLDHPYLKANPEGQPENPKTSTFDARAYKIAKNALRTFVDTLRWVLELEDSPDSIEEDTHFEACLTMLVKN